MSSKLICLLELYSSGHLSIHGIMQYPIKTICDDPKHIQKLCSILVHDHMQQSIIFASPEMNSISYIMCGKATWNDGKENV